jgi:hypothetical protein
MRVRIVFVMSTRLTARISEVAIRRGFREIRYWETCVKIWLHMLLSINMGKNVEVIVAGAINSP